MTAVLVSVAVATARSCRSLGRRNCCGLTGCASPRAYGRSCRRILRGCSTSWGRRGVEVYQEEEEEEELMSWVR